MSDTFSGYNLNISLGSPDPIASVNRKSAVIDSKVYDFPNIISHYVEQKGNGVGKDSFLLFKDKANRTMLSYGIITDKYRLPDINSTAVVTEEADVVCFDASLFLDHGLAVVDCAKVGSKVFTTYTNYWYIIDLTDHTVKKKLQNDIYIGFTSITKRKLMKFSHPAAGGFNYLLRSYFSDAVDSKNSDNTYL